VLKVVNNFQLDTVQITLSIKMTLGLMNVCKRRLKTAVMAT